MEASIASESTCMIVHKIIIANSVVEGQATKSVQLLKGRRFGRIDAQSRQNESVLYRTNKKPTQV